ncbi:MAG: putative lipid II flippase FtsW [Endomicrobiaceae bacterium]|jgi:cell division protein FtsW|nr:putative lipid II flippase FtsW [Endomicrobiaceae bacterium]
MAKIFTSIKNYIDQPVKKNRSGKQYHILLLIILISLVLIGIHFIISVTPVMAQMRFSNEYMFIIRHFLYVAIGTCLFFITGFKIDYRKYQKWSKKIYIVALILLVVVILVGQARKGATRWINLGFITFQPSEFAKMALAIVMSDFLARKQRMINLWENDIKAIVYLAGFVGLIIMQKDFGTSFLMASVWLAMMFIAGVEQKRFWVTLGCMFCVFSGFILMQQYRIKRFLDYINSFFDISLAQYNIKHALIAFGSGGCFGKGPGQSEMKLLHLPEMHTDFIFAIIGEEYGFMGAVFIICLFICFLSVGIFISRNCENDFGKYLAFSISLLFAIQALINMATTTGVFPAKGMPLPFISYGGTSMLISMTMAGVLFNIARGGKR